MQLLKKLNLKNKKILTTYGPNCPDSLFNKFYEKIGDSLKNYSKTVDQAFQPFSKTVVVESVEDEEKKNSHVRFIFRKDCLPLLALPTTIIFENGKVFENPHGIKNNPDGLKLFKMYYPKRVVAGAMLFAHPKDLKLLIKTSAKLLEKHKTKTLLVATQPNSSVSQLLRKLGLSPSSISLCIYNEGTVNIGGKDIVVPEIQGKKKG